MSDSKEKLREARKKLREAEEAAGINPRRSPASKDYDDHRADAAARSRAKAKAGQDIGPCPTPNMVTTIDGVWRREACSKSLILHCKTYHAPKFYLPWSNDQIEAAEIEQEVLIYGGKFALAMTRGGGKTTISRCGVEWAILNGYRNFIEFLGATDPLATKSLRAIKSSLARNDLLLEDYPEVCFPIRCLDNNPVRARMQTCGGRPTNIKWADDEIWLPDVEGSKCANSIIYVAGITGAVRGPNVVLPNGESRRPDCVVADDVQTRESAKSPSQTSDRELIIQGDVLELAGPDVEIAFIMPCTKIYPNDLSCRLLDRQRYPDFQGKTYKAINKFPANMKLWDEYAHIRAESLRNGNRGKEATEFYAANREAMDEGADVAWEHRIKKGDLSALQTAMNVFFSKPKTFAAEWQNEPEMGSGPTGELRQLAEEDLIVKFNTLTLGVVPRDCNKITVGVDLGLEILFYVATAWSDKFGGAIIDYGTYPPQPAQIFEASAVPRPLSSLPELRDMSETGRLYAALAKLIPFLSSKSYLQQDFGGAFTLSNGLIDCGKWTDTVHEFLGRSPHKALWRPSKGSGFGPNKKSLNDYRKDPGDEKWWNSRCQAATTAKGRFVEFDTWPWKSKIAEGLLAAPGSATAIYLPGSKPIDHPLLVLHLLSEYRHELTGSLTGRKVEQWMTRPDNKENHLWDAFILSAVAANVGGLNFSAAIAAGEDPEPEKPKPAIDARADYERKRREFEARRR